jgi:hypothetical protein
MPNTILIKRSAVANSVPASGNLQAGELAINYTDGNLFYKDNGGNVNVIASDKFVNVSGNINGANLNISNTIFSNNIVCLDAGIIGNIDASNAKIFSTLSAVGNIYAGNIFFANSIISGTGTVVAGNIVANSTITASGNISGNYFIGNGSQLTGISTNAFSTLTVTAQSNVVANSTGVVNFVPGSGVTIATDPTTGTVTFASTSTSSIFLTGGSMGLVTAAVTSAEDLGLITDAWTTEYDLGTLIINGLVWPDQFKLPSYVVMGLPSPSIVGLMAFATNAAGGSIPVFSDGTNWRRVDDRSIVT